jgi:uncharacterized membrane protein
MGRQATQEPRQKTRRAIGAGLVGVALGGFFDGIMLHQILQWHHLLSAVTPDGTAADLRFHVLADGIFHLSHYILALVGIVLLWSCRHSLRQAGAGRHMLGWILTGFGGWHAFDAVVSHWLLQLHRIRMDVENPLLWDLLWLFPFGIVPLAVGILLLRNADK